MTQHHFTVVYNTETNLWDIDSTDEAYFPDGNVWTGEEWVVFDYTPEISQADYLAMCELSEILNERNEGFADAAHL